MDDLYDLQDPAIPIERKAEIYRQQRDFLSKTLMAKYEQVMDMTAVQVWLMHNGYNDILTAAKVAVRLEKQRNETTK
jgi:hypothetical protein